MGQPSLLLNLVSIMLILSVTVRIAMLDKMGHTGDKEKTSIVS